MTAETLLSFTKACIHAQLDHAFLVADLPKSLDEAARYAALGGGKRVRPALCFAAYMSCSNASLSEAEKNKSLCLAATALELIHSYSLVHDDLPCMDDDYLRRGKPTCHIQFGEASALLVGDVLQALAFEQLAKVGEAQLSWQLSKLLAPAARRMVSGQTLDLLSEGLSINQAQLEQIHKNKTGALIQAAVLMGGACAQADTKQTHALTVFADKLGLAFQVQDDILDVTASTQALGKPAGSDDKLNKSTYPRLLGLEAAKLYANSLFDEAKQALGALEGSNTNMLAKLANWLWTRKH